MFFQKKFNKSKSQNTLRNCHVALKSIDEFVKSKYGKTGFDEVVIDLRKSPESAIFNFLQSYIDYKAASTSPISIKSYFGIITEYLYYLGIKLYPQDIQSNISLPTQIKNLKHPLEMEVIKKIIDNCSPKRRAFYLSLLSSGARPGELMSLRKRDFNTIGENVGVTIPAKYTKKKLQRETYLSKEAGKYVLPILEMIKDDDLVYTNNKNSHNAVIMEDVLFARLRRKIGLDEKYDDSNTHKITIYSFRSYCDTVASNIHGSDYSHALIGHSGYMDVYYRLTPEQRLQKYKQIEPYLTVYGDHKLNKRMEDMQTRMEELENTVRKLAHENREMVMQSNI